MKYVLDASVALKWVLTEADSPKALSIRGDFRNQLHELLAPDVFPVEVAHALTRAERKRIIKPPQAIRLLTDVLSTPLPLHSCGPLLPSPDCAQVRPLRRKSFPALDLAKLVVE